jgi:hypothetical protein
VTIHNPWLAAFHIVVQLVLGIGAGLAIAMYIGWRRWFMRRLHDLENDVEDMYIMHGITPPGVSRARHQLGLDRDVFDAEDQPTTDE